MEIEGFENYLIFEDGRVFNKKTENFMKITECTSKNSKVVNLTHYGAQKCFTIKTLVGRYYTPKGGKPIEEDPNYIVYPDGRVYGLHKGDWKILTPNRDGYIMLSTKINGKKKSLTIHRLVAKAFIPNPENLPFVDHKDRDKSNNNVDNLRWCSRQVNNCNKSKQKNNTSGHTGIRQNEWGNWKAMYRLGKDENGKRIQKSKTFKNKEDAIKFREEMVRLHYNIPV